MRSLLGLLFRELVTFKNRKGDNNDGKQKPKEIFFGSFCDPTFKIWDNSNEKHSRL